MNILNRASGKSINQKILIVSLVFLFIFADILCENFIGIVYNGQSHIQAFLFFLGFVLLQILFAPLQSALSDRYGRKKSLVVSLFFSLLSLGFIYIFNLKISHLSFLIFATLSKGALGNTLPISLAVIADTRDKNYRLLFTFSTAAYALAYLILASLENSVSQGTLNVKINYYLTLLFIVLLVLCIKLLNDVFDKDSIIASGTTNSIQNIIKNEASLLVKDLQHTPTRHALIAFFFWETSLYSILLSQIDFQVNKVTHIAEWMMYGYLLGVVALIFSYKIKDSTSIKIGYFISFLSLIPYFILYKIVEDQNFLLKICYFSHAFGNAFLSPALLSMLAKERKPHEQGRIYGLVDSVDSLGYLGSALAIMLIFNILKINLIYLIFFSFISFVISLKYYNRFSRIKY